jgi:hypothetical protein
MRCHVLAREAGLLRFQTLASPSFLNHFSAASETSSQFHEGFEGTKFGIVVRLPLRKLRGGGHSLY